MTGGKNIDSVMKTRSDKDCSVDGSLSWVPEREYVCVSDPGACLYESKDLACGNLSLAAEKRNRF